MVFDSEEDIIKRMKLNLEDKNPEIYAGMLQHQAWYLKEKSYWEINQIFHTEKYRTRTWWHTAGNVKKQDLAQLWEGRINSTQIFEPDEEAQILYQ